MPITLANSAIYTSIPSAYAVVVSLGKNVRRLRRLRDMRQEDLATALGIEQGTVSKWETGKNQPDATILPRLALMLESSIDDLLRGVDPQYDARRDLPGHDVSRVSSPARSGLQQGGRQYVRERTASSRLQPVDPVLIKTIESAASSIATALAVAKGERVRRKNA